MSSSVAIEQIIDGGRNDAGWSTSSTTDLRSTPVGNVAVFILLQDGQDITGLDDRPDFGHVKSMLYSARES